MATMDEAVALGINLFDTTHSYADGASERCIGEWLRSQTARARAAIRISTKVGNVVTDSGISKELTPRNIAEQLSVSLARLAARTASETSLISTTGSNPIRY